MLKESFYFFSNISGTDSLPSFCKNGRSALPNLVSEIVLT